MMDRFDYYHKTLRYVTNWGFYLWGAFLFTSAYAHLKYQLLKSDTTPLPADSSSPWLSWKVVSVLFSMALGIEIAITLNYWLVLHKPGSHVSYRNFVVHALPLIALTIDWHLNRILVEYRQIVYHMLPTIGYTTFLIAFVVSCN